jgi:hypothetical protein
MGRLKVFLPGINQEEVFSTYDFDLGKEQYIFRRRQRKLPGIHRKMQQSWSRIYILEYTEDEDIIKEIGEYCNNNGFKYYISDSIELD